MMLRNFLSPGAHNFKTFFLNSDSLVIFLALNAVFLFANPRAMSAKATMCIDRSQILLPLIAGHQNEPDAHDIAVVIASIAVCSKRKCERVAECPDSSHGCICRLCKKHARCHHCRKRHPFFKIKQAQWGTRCTNCSQNAKDKRKQEKLRKAEASISTVSIPSTWAAAVSASAVSSVVAPSAAAASASASVVSTVSIPSASASSSSASASASSVSTVSTPSTAAASSASTSAYHPISPSLRRGGNLLTKLGERTAIAARNPAPSEPCACGRKGSRQASSCV